MTEPLHLRMGADSPAPNPRVRQERIAILKATVEKYLPDFVAAIPGVKEKGARVALHQDGFAAGYDRDEYMLLGMFVKYLGLSGVEVMFLSHPGETAEKQESV
jgi:hypothetical protein